MINFNNISVSFNNRPILKNFDLKIQSAEKVLITGKSGIGKSTLLHLLLGFQRPDDGEIFVNGHALDKKTVWEVRKKVGYVSQDADMADGKVGDFLRSILSYHANKDIGLSNQELKHYLEYFELPRSILNENLEKLSGGEKQRIAIISALLLKRNIYLLDEPTAALDSEMKKKVARFFLTKKNWLVLVISHDVAWQDDANVRIVNLEAGYAGRS